MSEATTASKYDRTEENIGNVLNMEHINLTVPDQQVAALFYVTGLGFTRDPYIDFGTFNMWVNTGEQQFHLPKNTAQRWRGHIGVVVPSLEDLKRRLQFVAKPLADTEFAWEERDDHIRVTCRGATTSASTDRTAFPGATLASPTPRRPSPREPPVGSPGSTSKYSPHPPTMFDDNAGRRAEISMGFDQQARVSGDRGRDSRLRRPPHRHLRGRLRRPAPRTSPSTTSWTEESDQHQYRFQAVVDPDTGDTITELEHEVRSPLAPHVQAQPW